MKVFKYQLGPSTTEILMPAGAQLLCVQPQGHDVCLWAKVDPEARNETRRVVIAGTGHELPSYGQLKYINTFMVENGAFVFHAFEIADASL